ncbi:MAG: hypothetical protein ACR2GE_14575, partial [Pseudonocardia sp.]
LRHGTVTAERRVITVLFADLVGFTGLAEAPDPEDVATVQDAYVAHAADAIGRNGGRVEKPVAAWRSSARARSPAARPHSTCPSCRPSAGTSSWPVWRPGWPGASWLVIAPPGRR